MWPDEKGKAEEVGKAWLGRRAVIQLTAADGTLATPTVRIARYE